MADTRRLPGPNADVWDWQLEGACRGMDSGPFSIPMEKEDRTSEEGGASQGHLPHLPGIGDVP